MKCLPVAYSKDNKSSVDLLLIELRCEALLKLLFRKEPLSRHLLAVCGGPPPLYIFLSSESLFGNHKSFRHLFSSRGWYSHEEVRALEKRSVDEVVSARGRISKADGDSENISTQQLLREVYVLVCF
jgi:hypothetical protein